MIKKIGQLSLSENFFKKCTVKDMDQSDHVTKIYIYSFM